MKWTVKHKLLGTFVVVLVAMTVLGYLGLANIKTLRDNGKDVANDWLLGVETINSVKIGTSEFLNNHYQSLLQSDAAAKKKFEDQKEALIPEIEKNVQNYERTVSDSEDRNNYNQLRSAWDRFAKDFDIVTNKPQSAEAKAANQDIANAFATMQKMTDTMIAFNHNGSLRSVQDSESLYKKSMSAVFYLGVGFVLLLIAIAWVLIRNITIPLKAATFALHQIAAGNLSIERIQIKRKDEFGELLVSVNGTVQHLRHSVQQMQDSAGMVASSAEQLNASSDQNAGAAQQVAHAISEVAANSERQATTAGECDRVIEEMADGVQRIAETTSEVADLSAHAASSAREGAVRIREASGKISSLYQAIEEAGAKVRQLESQSHQIGEISGLIGEIAAQTHLLALNAAIEAARAGEHGSGFAVVAGEVRKLATQTDESVRGIGDLIATIRQHMGHAAEMMQSGLAEVQEGVEAVTEAERAFEVIVGASADVSSRVQEAAAAAEQLAASSEEVAASVANMGHMATRTASMSQQVAASTEEQLASSEEIAASSLMLSKVAEELQEMVKTFKL
ncbi:methyl-accepting chemotaxis protein [Cohnella nanjingensis]|uniref:Methyl-accepting chemotaxis protein n=1 Tax=Cohnella nanjingensis TaxID=1387779 RepID=A0A7X0RN49_9BACL|nr:methyl-accepting chemotaxis protein [Cohnella nanjingensis]MBB6669270.1 methyl-accepting chemotaxis protein [Cohnella nanjingensis]